MPALFPMRRPAMVGAPPIKQPDQYDPTGIGQQRRPGLFGRLSKVNWSDVLQTLGSGLQQMDGGTELSDYIAARDDQMLRRDMWGRQVRSDKREEAQQQQQQDAIASLADGLTPQQQAAALLNPNAAATAAFRQPEAPDWNLDPVTGRPFTVTPDGQVRYGQGNVNVRPTGGDSQNSPPAGYRFTADGNLEAIPGGPADIRAGESAQRTLRSIDTAVRNQRNVLDAIHTAEGYISGGTTGLMGQVTQGIGGTDSYNLRAAIDTIRANIGFEALQEMRANSQTGGALGQVAVRELELLQATVRNLDQAQSEAQLRRNLAAVRQQYERSIAAMVQARQAYSGDETQAPTNDGSAPTQPRVLRWNSQTGRLE